MPFPADYGFQTFWSTLISLIWQFHYSILTGHTGLPSVTDVPHLYVRALLVFVTNPHQTVPILGGGWLVVGATGVLPLPR